MSALLAKNWSELIKPSKIDIKSKTNTKAQFVIEPLERGFGTTMGNALRRVLLSSIRGAAITGMKVEGVLHEFSTINKVSEDVTDIILNLKSVAIELNSPNKQKARLNVKGPKQVTAGMIETNQNFAIKNPDLVICNVQEGGEVDFELTIESGKGYIPANQNKPVDAQIGFISIDALYSPVKQVSFKVEDSRVGQVTDYDKLTLLVETNGTVTPEDAVALAAKIIQDQMNLFVNFEEAEPVEEEEEDQLPFNKNLLKKVTDIELSVRSANCLENDNIVYIGDLVRKTEGEMLKTPNFGRKSLNEIKQILGGMGLKFGMTVEDWPPQDIETLAKKYEDPYN